jgi:glycine/D-amino acid oxidase-like deaminating enzyme
MPQPPLLGSAAFAPGSTIKQNPDGRIVSSASHEGSGLTLGLAEQGQQILQSAARYFPRLQRAKIERVSIGYRVLPADGFPILGFTRSFGNLYVAVTHSGVTLAPVIAQFATQEILEGVAVESLAPYRPSRFT